MKDIRIFLYELRAYLVYVKVVENSVPSVRKSCPSFSTSVPFVYYRQFMYVSLPFSFEEGGRIWDSVYKLNNIAYLINLPEFYSIYGRYLSDIEINAWTASLVCVEYRRLKFWK